MDLPGPGAAFVHVPKTAGYSVTTALWEAFPEAVRYPVRGWRMPSDGGAALSLRRQAGAGILGRRWSFCFVRDPWDWTVSGWTHVTRNTRAYGDDPPDFRAFVAGDWRSGLVHNPHALKFAGPEAFVAYHTKVTQHEHLLLARPRRLAPIAFYARFERLAEDWARICERLGRDIALPHRHRSERTHYAEYYDDETRRIVAERNAPLIARFGYRFGG